MSPDDARKIQVDDYVRVAGCGMKVMSKYDEGGAALVFNVECWDEDCEVADHRLGGFTLGPERIEKHLLPPPPPTEAERIATLEQQVAQLRRQVKYLAFLTGATKLEDWEHDD